MPEVGEPEADREENVEEALQKEIAAQEKIARETAAAEEKAAPEEVPEEPEEKLKRPQAIRPVPDPMPKKEEKTKPQPVEEPDRSEELSDEDYDDSEEMDTDEFAQYACKYASEIDCSITGKSMLALYERIEMMEEDGVRLTRKAAVDLIEEAADKAEKKTLGKKLTSFLSPTYDKDGYLILREKDFFD